MNLLVPPGRVSQTLTRLVTYLVASVINALPAALALEAFVPSPEPRASSITRIEPCFGTDWVAYEKEEGVIGVANRTSGEMILQFDAPAERSPVAGQAEKTRTVFDFGQTLAAEGNRLATLCRSSFSDNTGGWSIFVWDVPSGYSVGIIDFIPASFGVDPFLGLSQGRLVLAGPDYGVIHSWDVNTLAPFRTSASRKHWRFPGTSALKDPASRSAAII